MFYIMGNVKKVRIDENIERQKTILKTVFMNFGYILCSFLVNFLLKYY